MSDISDVLKRTLEKTGRNFRDLALDGAANLCDELHAKGLSAAHCAVAIRMLKEKLPHADNSND